MTNIVRRGIKGSLKQIKLRLKKVSLLIEVKLFLIH